MPTTEELDKRVHWLEDELHVLRNTLQMMANTMVVEFNTGGTTSHIGGLRQWANTPSSYTNVAPHSDDVRKAFATVLFHIDNQNDQNSSLLLKWEQLQKEVREQTEVLHARVDEIMDELDA